METATEVALVTGASRGIGRAIAVALAASGRHVVINYRANDAAAEETRTAIEQAGGSAELARFDVADAGAAPQAVQEIVARHGRLDILVHNAGITRDMLLVWLQPEDWRSVLATKLDGFYHLTRPVVKSMLERRSGRIIAIASASGQIGVEGQVSYSAANAGLIGATKALAREVAKRNITVNAIAPGFIETEMTRGLDASELAQRIPMRRFGRPEEVAELAVFLASPRAAYITGQVIGINGGLC